MSIIKHLEEIANEEGADLQSYRSNEGEMKKDGETVKFWYDENTRSCFAWNAFISGFGTSVGESLEDAVENVIANKKRQDEREAETITLTIGEIQARWGMSDRVCDALGLKPWCLNEGLANTDTKILVSRENARKIGIMNYEFDSRRK